MLEQIPAPPVLVVDSVARRWREAWVAAAVVVDTFLAVRWSLAGVGWVLLLVAAPATLGTVAVDSLVHAERGDSPGYVARLPGRGTALAVSLVALGAVAAVDVWLAVLVVLAVVLTHPAPWRRWRDS